MKLRKKQVVVIGGNNITEKDYKIAYDVGAFIAELQLVLISGGRNGIMEAASKGAREKGGIVVGILPSDNLNEANDYCDIVVPSGIGYARNSMNVLSGDIVISISGGFGTLSEICYANIYNKPVILCTYSEGISRDILKIESIIKDNPNIIPVDNTPQLMKKIKELCA